MEIVDLHYIARSSVPSTSRFNDRDKEWEDEDGCIPHDSEIDDCGKSLFLLILCSRPGRATLLILTMFILYLTFIGFSHSVVNSLDNVDGINKPRDGINITRAEEVLSGMCTAYEEGRVSGDLCARLCFDRKWTVTDYYEGNKVVVVLKEGGQSTVLKSAHPFMTDFKQLDKDYQYDEFTDKMLEVVNEELQLGWPSYYKRYLVESVWPSILRTPGEAMSKRDMASVWMLLQQPEFMVFRIINLAQVTPKIIGTCGHFYQTETLVAFKMKGYYMNLKSKILVHIMGTLKLLYQFLNDPLQWCDVRFDNLGLSADYPKRFVIMDADLLYTESRLNSLLERRTCKDDADCAIGDCLSRCQADFTCSPRSNTNLEVFCDKLVNKLFGHTWSKNNQYLVACHDTSNNMTQRLNNLRLAWAWNLPDF